MRDIALLPDSEESILLNTSNDTVTNIETNDETLAKKNNEEADTETVTEKSFDAKMVIESCSSEYVQDEANPLRRYSRIRKEPDRLMYYHNH